MNPALPARIETLARHSFIETQVTAFPEPALAGPIGLQVKNGAFASSRVLRFKAPRDAVAAGECGQREILSSAVAVAAPLVTEVECTFPLQNGQAIKPFPITFAETEMPLGGGGRRVMRVRTRLLHGVPWRTREAAVSLFECQFPERRALTLWNDEIVSPVMTAINVVQQGRPTSVLPTFTNPAASALLWLARFSVVDENGKGNVAGSVDVRLPGESRAPAGSRSSAGCSRRSTLPPGVRSWT
jgi:hypothetical protein